MVRVLAGVLAASALSACATAPKTPSELILGKWTCQAEQEGMSVVADITYTPDGAGEGLAKLAIKAGGLDIALTGDLSSAWRFLPDGKLEETVRSLTVKTANTGGADAPPSVIASMVQPVVDQMIAGQTSTATVLFDGPTMTEIDADGSKTICRR